MEFRIKMGIIGFVAIIIAFIALIICFTVLESEELLFASSFLAATVSTITIIIAVMIMHNDTSTSKKFEELYLKDKK